MSGLSLPMLGRGGILRSLVLLSCVASCVQHPSYKLLTRSSDGSPLCAVDRSSKNVSVQSAEMSNVPAAVQCAMKCTSSVDCIRFNFIYSYLPEQCQMFNTSNVDLRTAVVPGCQHFINSASAHQAILVQQHANGTTSFNRPWAKFKLGFGDPNGDYWIGNDRLHELTKDGIYKLRVDLLSSYNGQWYWAEYSTFIVDDESTGYRLHFGGYGGTAGDAMTAVEPRDNLNGMQFTTWDRDNDLLTGDNCASQYYNVGGFWFNSCGLTFVNGDSTGNNGFSWWTLPTGGPSNSTTRGLLVSRLSLFICI